MLLVARLRPVESKTENGEVDSRGGYVELPYTLPQDSTVFLLLESDSPVIWKKKLDWVAENGGMALLNVHPDYMNFDKSPAQGEYCSSMYSEFLKYVLSAYAGAFWLALPSQVSDFVRDRYGEVPSERERRLHNGSLSPLRDSVAV